MGFYRGEGGLIVKNRGYGNTGENGGKMTQKWCKKVQKWCKMV
jgi:hypothetical protein